MVCPLTRYDMSRLRNNFGTCHFEVANPGTGRSLFLMADEMKFICKSWRRISDKEEFAWNVFSQIFKNDPSIEERFTQHTDRSNENDEDEPKPVTKSCLEDWEKIHPEEMYEMKQFQRLLLSVPDSEERSSQSELSSAESTDEPDPPRRKISPTSSLYSLFAEQAKKVSGGKRSGSYQAGDAGDKGSTRGREKDANGQARRDSLQHLKNIAFEVLTMNMTPLMVTEAAGRTAAASRTEQLKQDDRRGRRWSVEMLNQLRRRTVARDLVLPHLADFIKFWDRVISLISTARKGKDPGETRSRFLNLIRNLGRRHSQIRMATFEARMILLMKNAMLEEMSMEISRHQGRIVDDHSVSTLMTKRTPGKSRTSLTHHSTIKRCQMIRAWYKLVGFVLSEAKDEYLAQIRCNMQRKDPAPIGKIKHLAPNSLSPGIRISRSAENFNV